MAGRNNPAKMDPKLFVPFFYGRILPKAVRSFFRFGVPEYVDSTKENNDKINLMIDLNGDVAKKEPLSESTSSVTTSSFQERL